MILVDGGEIAFPKGEEAFAQKIALETKFPIRIEVSPEFKEEAVLYKEDDLDRIAAHLGLTEPSDKMTQIFDNFVDIQLAMETDLSRIDVYYRKELKRALMRGKSIPGFKYHPESDSINFSFAVTKTEDGDVKKRLFNSLPIVLGLDSRKSLDTRMAKLREIDDQIRMFGEARRRWLPPYFIVLHETVEMEIISEMIASDDRRWFADGMANAISLLVLQSRDDEKSLEELLEMNYPEPDGLAERLPSVDLVSWEAAENETKEYLASDYYHLATLAVLEMIRENGEGFISRLFSELRLKDRELVDMATVYSIFEEQTGGCMMDYIEAAKQRVRFGK